MIYAKKLINANEVYEKGITGKGVVTAILDSGIAYHKELESRIAGFYDFISHRSDCYDDNGHGTHVAGIIAGKKIGIAPDSKVIAFKVLDKNGNGDAFDSIAALDFIYHNAEKMNIRIVNISFGFLPGTDIIDQGRILEYMELLWKKGVVIVVAAGNKGPDKHTITVPGVHPLVITVGTKDSFSGIGPTGDCIVKPEVIAPGRHILSLCNEDNRYVYKSGTSMSTPIVSGAVALALEKKPQLSPKAVKVALYRSCTPLRQENNKSWGMINVDKFIKMV